MLPEANICVSCMLPILMHLKMLCSQKGMPGSNFLKGFNHLGTCM